MSNKTTKVSPMSKIIDSNYSPSVTEEWEGITYNIKKTLTLTEMLEFVSAAVQLCFAEGNDSYLPELRPFAIMNCIIDFYTDLDMPNETEERYRILYCSDIVDKVLNAINMRQFNDIVDGIDKKIEHRVQSHIDAVFRQMDTVMEALDSMNTQMSNLFNGVDQDQIQALIKNVSENGLDEEKLVEAYLHSTTKSDKEIN